MVLEIVSWGPSSGCSPCLSGTKPNGVVVSHFVLDLLRLATIVATAAIMQAAEVVVDLLVSRVEEVTCLGTQTSLIN